MTDSAPAASNQQATMFTLGQIAGVVWPLGNLPLGIQASLLSQPMRGFGLMCAHEDFAKVDVARLVSLLDKIPADFSIEGEGLSALDLQYFWCGFTADCEEEIQAV